MTATSSRLQPVTIDDGDKAEREARGTAIAKRRAAMGMNRVELSEASGVDRGIISKAERGDASPGTFDRLEAWFDARDAENGGPFGKPAVFEMSVTIDAIGFTAAVKGAREDAELMKQQLTDLMRAALRESKE